MIILEQIGYLPITRHGAALHFQLMSRRYERACTVLTSNKGFGEWGEDFGGALIAAALIDRLVQHCHNVNTNPGRLRLRPHAERAPRLHQAPPQPPIRQLHRQEVPLDMAHSPPVGHVQPLLTALPQF